MENFTLEEVKQMLDGVKQNGSDLLKERLAMYKNGSYSTTAKGIRGDVRDLIAYEKLISKLIVYIDKETKKKRKLSTKPEPVTPKNIKIISDSELRNRYIDGQLDDPKLETTLFPNGRPDK